MSGKIEKTNAVRLLDRAGTDYELIAYQSDADNLAATHVAEVIGVPVERVYKTLVLRGDRSGYFVCVVQGDKEVDLKAAARVSGNKSAALIPVKELLSATGYIRGGCSPIGMKRRLPTYIDASCVAFDRICISAGVRGLQICIAPTDPVRFVGAEVVPVQH